MSNTGGDADGEFHDRYPGKKRWKSWKLAPLKHGMQLRHRKEVVAKVHSGFAKFPGAELLTLTPSKIGERSTEPIDISGLLEGGGSPLDTCTLGPSVVTFQVGSSHLSSHTCWKRGVSGIIIICFVPIALRTHLDLSLSASTTGS